MPSENPYEVTALGALTGGVKVWNKDTGEWAWTTNHGEISAVDLAALLNDAYVAGREAKAKEIREQMGL